MCFGRLWRSEVIEKDLVIAVISKDRVIAVIG